MLKIRCFGKIEISQKIPHRYSFTLAPVCFRANRAWGEVTCLINAQTEQVDFHFSD
jgi:hypothetical protein